MSVLYKALQKAESENEQRQARQPGLDPERLAESGAIRGFKSRGLNWRVIGLSMTAVFVAIMGGAYYYVSTAPGAGTQVAAVTPPPATISPPALNGTPQVPVITQSAPTEPQSQPPAAAAPAAPPAVEPPAAAQAPAPSAPPAAPVAVAGAQPATPAPAAPVAVATAQPAAPAPAAIEPAKSPAVPAAAKPAPPVAAAAPSKPAREPMPQIAADSPARMLSPPISVRREEFQLAGVGQAIQVREVSNQAQSDVRLGYAALIGGQYSTALGFYERASKNEPTSVLALLGRGASYQKLGRDDEARAAYQAALKIDPQNLEALTNVTVITAQSQPDEALKRLLDLQAQYPNFSPVAAQLGMTYAKVGNLEGAIEHLQRAIGLTPDAPMYYYNLAVILDHAKHSDQALVNYKRVLEFLDGGSIPGLPTADIQRRVAFLTVQH